MKRTTTLGALAIVLTASMTLAGCGRSEEAGSDSPAAASTIGTDPATGDITIWAMGTEGELLPEFVKEFQKANPDVNVEFTAIPWDAAHNKIQTAIAGGNTPDLAMMGTTWMADFADAFATVPTDLDTTDYFPGALSTTESGDRAVGLPWYVDTRVLYYRTDLAEKAGWTKAPTTWDELKQMATDMQAKAGATFGIRLPAGNDAFQGTLWMPWSNGAEITSGDKWTLDSPEMVEAYEYYQSFFTDKIADPNADVSSGAQEASFVDDSTPMLIDGPFMRSSLASVGGDDFDEKYSVATLPARKSSVSFSGGANLVVFNDSDNASSAWKLAKWLGEAGTQASWFKTSGDLPAAQAAWDEKELADDEDLQVFGTQLETAKSQPISTSWVKVAAAADQALEQMRRGSTSAADALKDLQSKADSIGLD
ncbi:extracellular solute-binding protein [Kineosporia succinea]|uniref:Multiple sugar transport system substrate-binding protein n=1 Tax=Kineosporia succinea TaxID=84632 RepID=A0ABT9PDE0_9ACTN|nr:extracellular solute-binding protein [Kineosporia succinea]MDP9830724.1 multiple sugar transport system substrate-binding protein [Kineosporia succinea]